MEAGGSAGQVSAGGGVIGGDGVFKEVGEAHSAGAHNSDEHGSLLRRENWPTANLKELSNVVRGSSPRPAGDARYFNGNYIPWLTVASLTNLPDSRIHVNETLAGLTEFGSQFSRILHPGTVIIANSGATLGVAKILNIRCCANDGIAALLQLRSDVDGAYVVHQINSQTQNLRTVVATGNGQPNLNTGLIGTIKILLPSVDEQAAIGSALSSVDSLITSLEQLLTKKRQLKQGAMQELLTGKRRLPGFEGEWCVATLGHVVLELIAGVSVNSDSHESGVGIPSVIKTSALKDGVFDANECKAILATDLTRATTQLRKDTLLISRMNTPDLVGAVAYVDQDYEWLYLPDRVWMTHMRSVESICVRWLGYLLSSAPYKRLIGDTATGTSGSMKNISKGGLLGVPISFPTVPEQTAIAQVLSDLDTAITALEARLTKARSLKQGMAQALLTGRVRLVEAAGQGVAPAAAAS